MCSICGPSAWSNPDFGARLAWCRRSTTSCCVSNIVRTLRVQEALAKRLRRFNLTLEPAKTKLVEFGRYAQRHAGKRGRKRPETIYFLGFTLYCTRNRELSDWHAYREIAPASRVDVFTRADAANAALTVARASGSSQSNASRSRCVLRYCRGIFGHC